MSYKYNITLQQKQPEPTTTFTKMATSTVLDLGDFPNTARALEEAQKAHIIAITNKLIPAVTKQFGILSTDTASGIIKDADREHLLQACLHVLGWTVGDMKSPIKSELDDMVKTFHTRVSIQDFPGTHHIMVFPTKGDERFTTHDKQVMSVIDKTLMPIAGRYRLPVPNTARYMMFMDFVEKTFPDFRLVAEDCAEKSKSRFIMRSSDNMLTMHISLENRQNPNNHNGTVLVDECWFNYIVVRTKARV
jgi:hypothetical protein